jgi:hypothetical protein
VEKGMEGEPIGRLDAHGVEKIDHKGIDPVSQCPKIEKLEFESIDNDSQ